MLPSDVKDAARLVGWGLRPRTSPEHESDYRDLVRRWLDDGEFRSAVAAVAEGLHLTVVGVTARTGIVLGAEKDSVFAYTVSRFRRHVMNEEGAVVALVLVAICATFYPDQDALETSDELASPNVKIAEVRDRLRRLCEALEMRAKDGDAAATRWRKGWESILALPVIDEDAKRLNRGNLHGLVGLLLNHLVENGLVILEDRGGANDLYVAHPRLRMMLAENAALPLIELARAAKTATEAAHA